MIRAAAARSASGRDFDVIIVGAGVVGSVMASLLVARRLAAPGRVAIIADKFTPAAPVAPNATAAMPEPEWGLRVFALSPAVRRLLDVCGIWQHLPPGKVFAYETMRVWDAGGEPDGQGSLTFDCAELGEPNLGYIVDGRALQTQCARGATAAGVTCVESTVAGLAPDPDGIGIRLRDGRELQCQLLIAADGTESTTRGLLGIETAGHAYHQDALVGHVRTARAHRDCAWQRFLDTGPLAFLPLPDGRSSIVWSVGRTEAARLRALDATAFGAALTAASGDALGTCELTTPLASFPLKLQYALNYIAPRAVLLGDAAHAVHPLAGQGLNLGLADCAALCDVLADSGSTGGFGGQKSLRRYERWRRSENLLTAAALDGLERLFASPFPGLSRLRAAGLDAVDRMPFVKRLLAERALGIRGDVPAFLRTERHG